MRMISFAIFLLCSCHQNLEQSLDVPSSKGFKSTLEVPYATLEGVDQNLLSLDIYAPEKAAGAPVLLFVHGGGWRTGDKTNQMQRKPAFVTGLGFVFVSVNYRLSPAIQHPEHTKDLARALGWVHKNITSYGGDPARIALMGHSAGAHLVSLVATDDIYLREVGLSLGNLRGVVALDGAGYDIPLQLESAKKEKAQDMYQQAFTADPAVWRAASPYYHIKAGKGIPPFLLIHAGSRKDSSLQAKQMADALTLIGVKASTFRAENKDHAAVNKDVGTDDEMTKQIVAFLTSLQ
jgi:arylformamidase